MSVGKDNPQTERNAGRTDCFITLFPGSGRVCGTLVDIDKYFVEKKNPRMNLDITWKQFFLLLL